MTDDSTAAEPPPIELPELETIVGMAGTTVQAEVGGIACIELGLVGTQAWT